MKRSPEHLNRFGREVATRLRRRTGSPLPGSGYRIKADGYEVGNHYVMDASVLVYSDTAFLDYLEKSDKAISIETRPKLFRQPGGVAWPKGDSESR